MSECKELQEEEREALCSIYEGDNCYKQINPTTYQYKYGADDDAKSFLVEILWTENYPMEPPTINMETFFNRQLVTSVKDKIMAVLIDEANQWLGCGMTYTLFECLKDKIDELVLEQPEVSNTTTQGDIASNVDALKIADMEDARKTQKKEHMTKSQKRRHWDRADHKGERARGWNWVDIIKHLSSTGSKDDSLAYSSGNVTTS